VPGLRDLARLDPLQVAGPQLRLGLDSQLRLAGLLAQGPQPGPARRARPSRPHLPWPPPDFDSDDDDIAPDAR